MTTLDPILVPCDGSSSSRAAVAFARRLAAATGARTRLLHVCSALDRPAAGFMSVHLAAEAMLQEEARRFETPVEVRVVEGPVPETIASEADACHAGLVVFGTRGRSVARGLLLGSVARWLLRAVRRPVAVVHEAPGSLTDVIAGVDAGTSAPEVARTAGALATALGAKLTLAHVVDADPDVVANPGAFGVPDEVFRDALLAHGDRVFKPLRALTGGTAEETLLYGVPAERLRALANERHAGLVVVGRRGESGRDVDAWLGVAFALAVRGPFATLVL